MRLGLTTQVPVREVYLTSGRSQRLRLGPKHAAEALRTLGRRLSRAELREIAAGRSRLPTWMAQEVSALARNA